MGSSMLFDPESWLELKNKKPRLIRPGQDDFSVSKHEDYISIYPHKIIQEIKKLVDHLAQVAHQDQAKRVGIRGFNRFRSGMYYIGQ
jgi:hypothetical protein